MKFLRLVLDALLPGRETHGLSSKTTLEDIGLLVMPSTYSTACGPIEALLPYREPRIRSLVLETKFHESGHAITLLGTVLGEYLSSIAIDTQFETTHIVLVPIPLSKRRHTERGYNQVERILNAALPFLTPQFSLKPELLRRTRDTAPQTTLNRNQRLRNMENAFHVEGEIHSDYTYIVIDDVSTTGVTLAAASKTLRGAGATHVIVLALAH